MRSKILSRRALLAVVLAGCALLIIALLFYFIPKESVHSDSVLPVANTVAPHEQEKVNYPLPASLVGTPVRLKIPVINVDAAVESVGLTAGGAMDVPKGPTDVAWLDLGPRPGENGSAVIAGHYGVWKNGEGSVFDNLRKLNKGDKIYVEDDKGASISFVIRESRRYDPDADASNVFSSNDGKSHLNLITCEVWDKVTESYSKRLVIFADKE